jgi:non-heme chloroperoxidase
VASGHDGRSEGPLRRYHRLFATDFTEDLKKITVPVLVLHGEDDQIVPFPDSGSLSAKLLKNSATKFYPGLPHGIPATNAEQVNADVTSCDP